MRDQAAHSHDLQPAEWQHGMVASAGGEPLERWELAGGAIESFPGTILFEDWLTDQARLIQWWTDLWVAGARLWMAALAAPVAPAHPAALPGAH